MSLNELKHIAISSENYEALKSMGRMGDSFNDVISSLLSSREEKQFVCSGVANQTG